MLKCQFKSTLGIECPGCGAQRAFLALLKGDLVESFYLFPALIPLIFIALFLPLHLIFKFKKGAKIIVYVFALTASLMLGNFIFKQYF